MQSELQPGQPAWRVALFYPEQGGWTEDDYFALDGGPLVEFDEGHVEVLDLPTKEHQRMAQFLFLLLHHFVAGHKLGEVFMAPLPVRLWPRKFREPDVVFVATERHETDGYPDGADLVMEIVSPGAENRRRDMEIKPLEYARASIAEYWAVDPESQSITVHTLVADRYESTQYGPADTIRSNRLPGLNVSVAQTLAAAHG
jgi:Uma2 family endonuclease